MLMLDEKDVEAVAKSRVSREENNKTNIWMVAAVVAIVGGVFIVNFSKIAGWAVSVAGFIAFIWYMNKLGSKQKAYTQKLLDEWNKTDEIKGESVK